MSAMSKAFNKLVGVMERLRGRNGCPWDREQTRETLKPFLLEETYEVLEAIEEKDVEMLREELGDVLFQVIFHAEIAKEKGEFTIEDVLTELSRKMIRRHPHVFSNAKVGTAKEALARWEILKSQESRNKKRKSVLDGVPRQLPALLRSNQLQSRASRVGFDWSSFRPVWKKVREELRETEVSIREGNRRSIESELGDLFFSLVNASRFLKVDPEDALRKANQRFAGRFREMEKRARNLKRSLSEMGPAEMDRLWEEAKAAERKRARRRRI